MSNVNHEDLLKVNREGVDYKISVADMSKLLPTDLLLINRAGVDYSCTVEEFMKYDENPPIEKPPVENPKTDPLFELLEDDRSHKIYMHGLDEYKAMLEDMLGRGWETETIIAVLAMSARFNSEKYTKDLLEFIGLKPDGLYCMSPGVVVFGDVELDKDIFGGNSNPSMVGLCKDFEDFRDVAGLTGTGGTAGEDISWRFNLSSDDRTPVFKIPAPLILEIVNVAEEDEVPYYKNLNPKIWELDQSFEMSMEEFKTATGKDIFLEYEGPPKFYRANVGEAVSGVPAGTWVYYGGNDLAQWSYAYVDKDMVIQQWAESTVDHEKADGHAAAWPAISEVNDWIFSPTEDTGEDDSQDYPTQVAKPVIDLTTTSPYTLIKISEMDGYIITSSIPEEIVENGTVDEWTEVEWEITFDHPDYYRPQTITKKYSIIDDNVKQEIPLEVLFDQPISPNQEIVIRVRYSLKGRNALNQQRDQKTAWSLTHKFLYGEKVGTVSGSGVYRQDDIPESTAAPLYDPSQQYWMTAYEFTASELVTVKEDVFSEVYAYNPLALSRTSGKSITYEQLCLVANGQYDEKYYPVFELNPGETITLKLQFDDSKYYCKDTGVLSFAKGSSFRSDGYLVVVKFEENGGSVRFEINDSNWWWTSNDTLPPGSYFFASSTFDHKNLLSGNPESHTLKLTNMGSCPTILKYICPANSDKEYSKGSEFQYNFPGDFKASLSETLITEDENVSVGSRRAGDINVDKPVGAVRRDMEWELVGYPNSEHHSYIKGTYGTSSKWFDARYYRDRQRWWYWQHANKFGMTGGFPEPDPRGDGFTPKGAAINYEAFSVQEEINEPPQKSDGYPGGL